MNRLEQQKHIYDKHSKLFRKASFDENETNCTPPVRSLKTFVIPKLAHVDQSRSLKEPFSYIQIVSEHPFLCVV